MRRPLLIASALLLFALPAAGVLWLLHSQAGLQWAIAQLAHLRTFEVRIDGATGTLAGPLRMRRFELDHPRVHVVVHDVDADFRLSGLFLLRIDASAARGRDVLVEVRRVPDKPDPDKATRFLPRFLHIAARNIELANVRYVNLNGLTLDADRVSAKRVRVSAADMRVDAFEAQAPWLSARGNYEMHSARPLRLAGDVAGTLRAPRGVPLELEAKLAGDLDELLLEAQLKSPDVANVRAVLTRPEDSWRLAGRIAAPSLGLDGVMQNPPLRFADVALRFEVIPDRIHADGALTIPGVGPLRAVATGRFADKRLTVTRAEVRAQNGAAHVLASGTVQFGGESPAIEADARWTQLQYPLAGPATIRSAQGQLQVSGAMPYAFTVSGALGGERVPPATLTASGSLSKDEVRLDAYAVRTLSGSLAGAGRMSFAQPQQWSIDAVASALDPAPLHADLPGRVSFTAQAQGSGLDRNALYDVRLDQLRGEVRGERVRGQGRVERSAAGWRLHDVDARWSTSRVAASGLVGERLDLRWSLRVRSLRRFIPELRGQVVSSGRAVGALAAPHVIATLDASNVHFGDWHIGAVQVDADVDAGSDRPSRLTLHASNVGRATPWLSDVQLDAAGNRAAHDLMLTVRGTGTEDTAPGRGQLRLRGSYENDVWTTQIYDLAARDDTRELKLQQPTRALLARDRAALDPLCLVIAAGTVCGQGSWQKSGAWSAQVQLDALPLAALLGEHEDEERLTGTVSGSASGSATAGVPWQGKADLNVADAQLHYKLADGTDESVQLGSGALAAAADLERFALDVDLRALENTFVRGSVHLARSGVAFASMPLQGEIQARTADANVLPLLFPDIDRAAGVLEADIKLSGNLAAPGIDGRIALSDGELDSYRVNLALRELQATAQLQDTSLGFNASAKVGDGQLSTYGRMQWQQREPRGWLRLSGKDLLVADLPEYRVVASPELSFQLDGRQIDVSGDVLIPSARIQPADLSGAVRVSDDAQLVGERGERGSGFTVASTIRTLIGDDVRLDTFGLQGKLQGEVTTVVRTAVDPIGRGELSIKEGRYEAYGQKLDITRGRLLMDNTPLDDPALDIQAERKLEEIKLGVNVRGTLRAPRLSFFSEPSMPQTQIVEYLLVGKPLNDYQSIDTQATTSTGSTLALQGGGLLASRLGRRVGLEEVGVESDENNNTALVLGKFLSPRLFVSYGISLAEAINTLKLRYTISDHWLLRTESGEAHAADLEFTIER